MNFALITLPTETSVTPWQDDADNTPPTPVERLSLIDITDAMRVEFNRILKAADRGVRSLHHRFSRIEQAKFSFQKLDAVLNAKVKKIHPDDLAILNAALWQCERETEAFYLPVTPAMGQHVLEFLQTRNLTADAFGSRWYPDMLPRFGRTLRGLVSGDTKYIETCKWVAIKKAMAAVDAEKIRDANRRHAPAIMIRLQAFAGSVTAPAQQIAPVAIETTAVSSTPPAPASDVAKPVAMAEYRSWYPKSGGQLIAEFQQISSDRDLIGYKPHIEPRPVKPVETPKDRADRACFEAASKLACEWVVESDRSHVACGRSLADFQDRAALSDMFNKLYRHVANRPFCIGHLAQHLRLTR